MDNEESFFLAGRMQDSQRKLRSVNILVRDMQERTLLQMRDGAAKSAPLLWGFWGGAVEDDDESACHAAARELREELGVIASAGHFMAIGSVSIAAGKSLSCCFIHPTCTGKTFACTKAPVRHSSGAKRSNVLPFPGQ